MDNGEYLQDGFDPSTLKVAQLRGVLNKHDVDFPSSAKKADLLGLFRDHITPRAKELRKQYEGITPNGDGIVDATPRRARSTRSSSPEKQHNEPPTKKDAKKISSSSVVLEEPKPRQTRSRRAAAAAAAVSSSEEPTPEPEESGLKADKSGQQEKEKESINTSSTVSPSKSAKRKLPSRRKLVTSELSSDEEAVQTKKSTPFRLTKTEELSKPASNVTKNKSPSKVRFEDMLEQEERDRLATKRKAEELAKKSASASPQVTQSSLKSTSSQTNTPQTNRERPFGASGSVGKSRTPTQGPVPGTSSTVTTPQFKIKRDTSEIPGDSSVKSAKNDSPFSDKNIFQKRRNILDKPISAQKRKREASAGPEGDETEKRVKKDEIAQQQETAPPDVEMLESIRDKREIVEQPLISPGPENDQSLEFISFEHIDAETSFTPKSPRTKEEMPKSPQPVRHYDAFPETPVMNVATTNIPAAPATISHVPSRDHSFPKGSPKAFMQPASELRISSQFRRQLEQQPQGQRDSMKLFTDEELARAHAEAQAHVSTIDPFSSIPVSSEIFRAEDFGEYLRDEEEIDRDLATAEKELKRVVHETEHARPPHTEEEKEEKFPVETRAEKKAEAPARWSSQEWKTYAGECFHDSVDVAFVIVRILGVFALVLYGLWFVTQKQKLGYCEVSLDGPFLSKAEPGIANKIQCALSPQCAECPLHGDCYPGFRLYCHDGYIKRENPFSFGGRLPIAPRCLPDMKRRRQVEDVSRAVLTELRKRNAKAECGSEPSEYRLMTEEDINEFLESIKSEKAKNGQEFSELLQLAMPSILAEKDVIVSTSKSDAEGWYEDEYPIEKKIFRSTSSTYFPMGCRVRNFGFRVVARYRRPVGIVVISTLFVLIGRLTYKRKSEYRQRIKKVVGKGIENLIEQRKRALLDTTGRTVQYITEQRLKSLIFPSEWVEKDWETVLDEINGNENIRHRQAEMYGEVLRVLEWIGEED